VHAQIMAEHSEASPELRDLPMMERICPGHSAADRRSFWLQASKDRHLNGVFAAQKHCYRELQQLRASEVLRACGERPRSRRAAEEVPGWRLGLSGEGVLDGLPAGFPDRLRRTRSRLLHDFRTEPRVRREAREILLCSRMLSLNEQEAASSDAEGVCLVVGDLALRCRGAAQVDLDSHDWPSFARVRVFGTRHGTPLAVPLSVSSRAGAATRILRFAPRSRHVCARLTALAVRTARRGRAADR
jgi:hypothetical protein